jgi:hypothetical protein
MDTMSGAAKVSGNIRLFLEPGMGHCGGGESPNEFDKVGSLAGLINSASSIYQPSHCVHE